MCSVAGCESERRGAQRFKLPEDPERRLEWVQFLAAVNKQRFKESSCTDITVCSEHFNKACLDRRTETHPGGRRTLQLTLNPGAVPSLQPEEAEESPPCVEPEETKEVACLPDQLKACDGPAAFSEESIAVQGSPVQGSPVQGSPVQGSPAPGGVSCSTDAPSALVSSQMRPKHMDFALMGEKSALLHKKGKYVVNERRLLQLFSHKCPSCGSNVKMEKVTCGLLFVLNRQCLQCDYRSQWKSQVDARVPPTEDQQLTEVGEVTPETRQAARQVVAVIVERIDEETEDYEEEQEEEEEEEDDAKDEDYEEEEEEEEDDAKDEDYVDEDDEDGEDAEQVYGDYPPLPVHHSRLCTECGVLYSKLRPHTCENKVKPYSCNICGKRFVSEKTLITHGRIHDENHEYQCKYCHAAFKTKVGKITHEQIHATQEKPYECPDCGETFATNKERRIHREEHGDPLQAKCHICGIDFVSALSLQRHMAVHTGDRPFKCSVCQRGFKQAGHLKSHERLHTGERPFKCPRCDERFNHNVSLKAHVRRRHSEKVSKRAGDAADARDDDNRGCEDSGLDDVEDGRDAGEEEAAPRRVKYRWKKKRTGRPRGRPKRHEADNAEEGKSSDAKGGELPAQRSKRSRRGGEGGEAESGDSGTSAESAEEEEEAIKSTASARGGADDSDSDWDFDPEERKRKRCSSQRRPRRDSKDDS